MKSLKSLLKVREDTLFPLISFIFATDGRKEDFKLIFN